MRIKIIERSVLNDVASASGIEKIGDDFWIISDNSPYLFHLGPKLDMLEKKVVASDTSSLENGVLPKKIKHDMEAMISFDEDGERKIMVFGSGSTINRMNGMIFTVDTDEPSEKFDLSGFYQLLMDEGKFDPEELNIEAACVLRDDLYLFNRDKQRMFRVDLKDFLEFAREKRNKLKIKSFTIELPTLDGIKAGFSGATALEEKELIIFTASVENTSDWVQDGKVLGSFVGYLPLKKIHNHYEPDFQSVHDEEELLEVKVESIVVNKVLDKGFDCYLVTDSDGGTSELIRIEIDLD